MSPTAAMPMTYIDTEELAVRIGEACMGNRRPAGMSTADAMKSLREMSAESAAGFERAALAAAEYIAECCNAVTPGSVEVTRVVVETRATQ